MSARLWSRLMSTRVSMPPISSASRPPMKRAEGIGRASSVDVDQAVARLGNVGSAWIALGERIATNQVPVESTVASWSRISAKPRAASRAALQS